MSIERFVAQDRAERGIPLVEVRELVQNPNRNHYIRTWSALAQYLPEDLSPRHEKFVRRYFSAQLRLAQGRPTKAKRIFGGLINDHRYLEFEQENKPLLAAIDLAVRGETRWDVEPTFRIGLKD